MKIKRILPFFKTQFFPSDFDFLSSIEKRILSTFTLPSVKKDFFYFISELNHKVDVFNELAHFIFQIDFKIIEGYFLKENKIIYVFSKEMEQHVIKEGIKKWIK